MKIILISTFIPIYNVLKITIYDLLFPPQKFNKGISKNTERSTLARSVKGIEMPVTTRYMREKLVFAKLVSLSVSAITRTTSPVMSQCTLAAQ